MVRPQLHAHLPTEIVGISAGLIRIVATVMALGYRGAMFMSLVLMSYLNGH